MRLGFLLLIGLPGSGKTTLAKNLIEHSTENVPNFIHVCYDDLVHFPNDGNEFEWKLARNSVSVKIENLSIAIKNENIDLCPPEFKNQLQLVSNWESDFVLIVDDNMYFKSMRYSLFQIAKKIKIGFCQLYLKCTIENALLKNKMREPNYVVPQHVIENMYSKMEAPNLKNNWEKYSLELDAFCNFNEACNKILLLINNSLNNSDYEKDDTEKKELSKIQCKKSVLHQADIALRKIIGFKIKKILSKTAKTECRNYIGELNLRKSELLLDIKSGIICLPDEILEEINSGVVEKFQLINFLDDYF